ncbi:MAG: mechanosensitive ion channel domain-containing protein [Candidatus Cyclobacteriaceae bacterium M2_1C_046]
MEKYDIRLIETVAVILILIVSTFIIRKVVNRVTRKFNFAAVRQGIIIKTFNFLLLLVAIIFITAIWSVNPKELVIFITSVMTILGIAFFAQWSILSNITSSLILFFNHPLKIGGPLKIFDKDYPIEGHIENITLFFLYIKTKEGDIVTIPTSVALTKIIIINYNGDSKLEEDQKYED